MLLYTTVGTNDLERAGRFYDAVLPLLGYIRQKQAPDEIGYAGRDDVRCRFWVVEPFNREPATFGNGVTIALVAPTRAAVDAFHAAALAAGGIDEGAPGLRPFHASFYAAFIRDPDGNKLAAVCERTE
ncbi:MULTISPECIES: VOC family protein [Shinella]|uniref:Catechol 2,3-dioxygenase-like lactoylglutathione lyase family enzyme n=1 Tax=Shinella granuli TaxID=323621 RepID=A0A4R2D2V7_SHIGR|nr:MULTISPECIES: VOC family protein [Shinella]ANH03184.1 glyoxalase [Shinella sp. HZN7]TCN45609.1 catechol 2,3-dioxygenase-like lactoylglutathione lyase family enzyme [Shinella granuli]